jgi:polysaccharide export outer membrane protein
MDYPLFSVYCTLKSNTVLLNLYMKTRINQLRPLALLLLLLPLFTSCYNTKKIIYFSNLNDTALGKFYQQDSVQRFQARIESGDILDIRVTSLNAAADAPFNLNGMASVGNPEQGSGSSGGSAQGGAVSNRGFMVDPDGFIDYPFVGKLKVAGQTTSFIRDTLESLLGTQYLQHPTVSVRFQNFKITILGEVSHPASYTITSEKVSIIDALGMAGDLTFSGKRENILVVREVNGHREFGRMDMTSSEVFKSPYFYLKQNDLVYVEPHKFKIITSEDRLTRNFTIFTSVITLVLTLIVLFK